MTSKKQQPKKQSLDPTGDGMIERKDVIKRMDYALAMIQSNMREARKNLEYIPDADLSIEEYRISRLFDETELYKDHIVLLKYMSKRPEEFDNLEDK